MHKRNKNKIIISSLVILGITFILIGSFQGKSEKSNSSYEEYITSLECKIEDFLKKVDGIRDAEVIITLEEYSLESDSGSTSVFGSNDIANASLPRVRGVAVACTNGDNYNIQIKVTEIISKFLGIPSNKIKIVSKK